MGRLGDRASPRVCASCSGGMNELLCKGGLYPNRRKKLPECTPEMPLQAVRFLLFPLSTPFWPWVSCWGSDSQFLTRPLSSASFDASAKLCRWAQQPSFLTGSCPSPVSTRIREVKNLSQNACTIIRFYLKFCLRKTIKLASQMLEHWYGPRSWHSSLGLRWMNYMIFSQAGVRV